MSAVRKIFAPPPAPAPIIMPPAPTPAPVPMPDPNSAVAIEDARTRVARGARRGRSGTILGGSGDQSSGSGSGDYTKNKLGA